MSDLTEAAGWFWLPSDESRQYPGTLRYSPEDGGEVSLHSQPGHGETLVEVDARPSRLNGLLGNELVTLDRCFPVETDMFGGAQRLSVGLVVKGACFNDDGPLEFSSISFEVDNAGQWIGRSAVQRDWRHDPDEGMRYQLTLEPLPSESEETEFGSVWLHYGWSTSEGHGRVDESSIRQTRRFELRFHKIQPLEEMLRWAGAVQDLITVATDSECLMASIAVAHPEVTREHSDQAVPVPLDLLIHNRGTAKATARPIRPHQMFFTYEQIGGLPGIARWLALHRRLKSAIDSLLSLRYGRAMYLENRLQNIVAGAETFHRLRFPNEVRAREEYKAFKKALVAHVPKEHREWLHSQLQFSNEPRLAARLVDLVNLGGREAERLVGNARTWADEIRDVRNGIVHDPSRNEAVNSERMHYLCESLFYVLVLCLIRDCGYDDDVASRIGKSREVEWVRQRLESLASSDVSI